MFTGIKQRFTQLIVVTIVIASCNSAEAPTQDVVDTTAQTSMEPAATSFPVSMVNNKKDPTCGMPVTAGISDPAHYDNKVLGFCSAGCKEEFLKNPKANMAAAEMK